MKRKILAAVVVALSLAVSGIASAQNNDRPAPDMDGLTTRGFMLQCEMLGGRPIYFPGEVSCVYKDGSKITCDIAPGGRTTNCKRVPKPYRLPAPPNSVRTVADQAYLIAG